MSIARHRAAAAQRLREFASPAEVGIVDPRTGGPPDTWRRAQELMVGAMLRGEVVSPAPKLLPLLPSITEWRRALL